MNMIQHQDKDLRTTNSYDSSIISLALQTYQNAQPYKAFFDEIRSFIYDSNARYFPFEIADVHFTIIQLQFLKSFPLKPLKYINHFKSY